MPFYVNASYKLEDRPFMCMISLHDGWRDFDVKWRVKRCRRCPYWWYE